MQAAHLCFYVEYMGAEVVVEEEEVECPSYPESDRAECRVVQLEMSKNIMELF